MKNKLIISLLLSLFCFNLSAQLVDTQELKGADSTYIKEFYKGKIYGTESYSIRNKNATFKNVESYYMEYSEYTRKYPLIEVSNKQELDLYVRVFLAPHFKNVKNENLEKNYIIVTLFSDIEGNLNDINIFGRSGVDIPVLAIEQFHKALLKSSLRLIFNNTTRAFRDSPWVGREYGYSFSELKQMALEE